MRIVQELLNDDPDFLERFIIGNETRVCGYGDATKSQSSQWQWPGELRPRKVRQVRLNVKVLILYSQFFF